MLAFPTAHNWLVPGTGAIAHKKLFEPGFGLGTILQVVPFHCSMSVWSLPLLLTYPTAQTLFAEIPVTPSSVFTDAPGLGLDTRLQVLPFHCSMSVCRTPLLWKDPTAHRWFVPGTRVTLFKTRKELFFKEDGKSPKFPFYWQRFPFKFKSHLHQVLSP